MATEQPIYDLILLLDPEAEEERRTNILASLEQIIERQGAIVSRHDWGLRPTAYEVRKRADADYHLLQFQGPSELLEQLSHALKITDGVNRFRIIKLRKGTPEPPDLAHVGRRGRGRRRSSPSRSSASRAVCNASAASATTLSRNPPNLRPFIGCAGSAPRLGHPRDFVKEGKEPLVAATNINRVVLTGNLTRDPELRSLPSGMSVCSLRIACNTRRKNNSTGEWEDKPNYFDVTVWGAQGENCARFLSKGRPVALDGRLEWREWEERETGNKRQAIDIIADAVQFLGGRDDGPPAGGGGFTPRSDVPVDDRDFQPVAAPVGRQRQQRRGRRHPVLGDRGARRRKPARRPAPLSGAPDAVPADLVHWESRAIQRAHSAAVSATVFFERGLFNSGEAAQPADAPA